VAAGGLLLVSAELAIPSLGACWRHAGTRPVVLRTPVLLSG